jgi:hypothetical protein
MSSGVVLSQPPCCMLLCTQYCLVLNSTLLSTKKSAKLKEGCEISGSAPSTVVCGISQHICSLSGDVSCLQGIG